jgi:hypothetical protein
MSDEGGRFGSLSKPTILLAVLLMTTGAVAGGYLTQSITTSGTVHFGASSAPQGGVTGGLDVNATNLSDGSGNTYLRTSGGNVTLSGPASANVTLDDITGTYTNTSSIDPAGGTITINPEDKTKAGVGGSIDTFDWTGTTTVDDQTVDYVYSGTSGKSAVTMYTLPASTTVGAVDAQSGAFLGKTTADGTGKGTFSSLDNSQHNVLLQTSSGGPTASDLTPDGTTERFEDVTLNVQVNDSDFPNDDVQVNFYLNNSKIGDKNVTSNGTVSFTAKGLSEGQHDYRVELVDGYGQTHTSSTVQFTVDHYDAVQSNPSPTGNLNSDPSSLSVDVEDRDFPNDGDTLQVYFYLDGNQVGTDTLNSNGTVSTSISSPTGGQHDWKAAVNDSYGQWTNQSYSFTVPNKLKIYNETDPGTLITNAGSVEVRFFAADQVVSRSTSNGKIDMSGLPVQTRMVVSASVNEFHDRRIVIESLYKQQEIYLLNKTTATESDIIYSLNDQSGDFQPGDTTLQIKKPLTKDFDNDNSDETRRQVISADSFGATNEYPTTLEDNARYRLLVKNSDGNTRDIGQYTVTGDASETIKIGNVDIPISGDKPFTFNTKIKDIGGYRHVRISFADPEQATSQLKWNITNRSGGSVVNSGTTVSGPLGTYSTVVNLSQYDEDTAMLVNYEVTRDGDVTTNQAYLGGVASVFGTIAIDPRWLQLIGLVGLVAITGLVTISNPSVAAVVAAASATLMTWIGILQIPTAALGVAGSIAILFAIGRQ